MKFQKPLNIAHRGARAHAPENTLVAARLAHEAGADMWELDACLTADGHLVVIHDDTLERTTDVANRSEFANRTPWRVDSFTLEELRSLDASSWFRLTDPFGTIRSGEVTNSMLAAYAGEKIPTLEEALLLTKEKKWRVNVEIKNHYGTPDHDKVAGQVAALVQKLGVQDSVVFSSFQHAYLKELGALLPSVPRGALVETPAKEGALEAGQKAHLAVMQSMTAAEALTMCRESGSQYFHPDKAFLTDAAFVAEVQAGACPINVWTVNTPEDMRRMLEYGVHGIITDYPGRLGELMR